MAKKIARRDEDLVKVAKEQALDLLKQAFAEARDRGVGTEGTRGPPLFPNGIERLQVKFEVGVERVANLAIELQLEGPKAGA